MFGIHQFSVLSYLVSKQFVTYRAVVVALKYTYSAHVGKLKLYINIPCGILSW